MRNTWTACLAALLAIALGAPGWAQDQVPEGEDTGAWSIVLADDPDGVGGIVTLEVQSLKPISYVLGRSGPAVLRLQCANNNTSFAFDFGDNYMSDVAHYGDMALSLDGGAAQIIALSASDDRQALGRQRGADAIPLITSWLDSQAMRISVQRLHGDPIEAMFPVAGLRGAIRPLRQQCRW